MSVNVVLSGQFASDIKIESSVQTVGAALVVPPTRLTGQHFTRDGGEMAKSHEIQLGNGDLDDFRAGIFEVGYPFSGTSDDRFVSVLEPRGEQADFEAREVTVLKVV